jgi:hypothetical protein
MIYQDVFKRRYGRGVNVGNFVEENTQSLFIIISCLFFDNLLILNIDINKENLKLCNLRDV